MVYIAVFQTTGKRSIPPYVLFLSHLFLLFMNAFERIINNAATLTDTTSSPIPLLCSLSLSPVVDEYRKAYLISVDKGEQANGSAFEECLVIFKETFLQCKRV